MFKKNITCIVLTCIAMILFVPGIYRPILFTKLDGNINSSVGKLEIKVFNNESSIVETIDELLNNDNAFVAYMILFFSICVPILKALLILSIFLIRNVNIQLKIKKFLQTISKWSMADVFVVAILLANLSTNSHPRESYHYFKILGMSVDLKLLLNLNSHLGDGFYYFTAYCILSMLGVQFLGVPTHEQKILTYEEILD